MEPEPEEVSEGTQQADEEVGLHMRELTEYDRRREALRQEERLRREEDERRVNSILYGRYLQPGLTRTRHFSNLHSCLLYTSPSPRDKRQSRMPSSA